jgi:ribosomal protein S1
MRIPILIVCGMLILPLPGLGQQNPTRPKKVLTPEQQVDQQQIHEIDAERQRFRVRAKQAFDAEMARERSGDCPDAKSNYEFKVCYANEVGITDGNLKTYGEVFVIS